MAGSVDESQGDTMFLDFLAEQLLDEPDSFLLSSDLMDEPSVVQLQTLQLQPENVAAVAAPQVRLACCSCGRGWGELAQGPASWTVTVIATAC